MKSSVAIVVCALIVMHCGQGLAFQEENAPSQKPPAASDQAEPVAHPAIAELAEMKVEFEKKEVELQKAKAALKESDAALKESQALSLIHI